MKTDWRTTPCPICSGHGVVLVYSHNDVEGPGECNECCGSGLFWLRPSGHVFVYPGGPARGSWPEEYARATPVTLDDNVPEERSMK